jgi:hypothetical protein
MTTKTRPWWLPANPTCVCCEQYDTYGTATIQLQGQWLCRNHYDQKLRESEAFWTDHLPLEEFYDITKPTRSPDGRV